MTIHPGGVTTFTVTVDRSGIQLLHDTIKSGNVCAIPARHPVHGERLLCARPVEPSWPDRPADAPPTPGPMVLDLRLPGAQLTIIFRRDRLRRLATTLAEILAVESSVAP